MTEETDKLPAGFTPGKYDHYGLPLGTREGDPGEWAYAKDDDTADRAAKADALGSLWAFQTSFLRRYVPMLNLDGQRGERTRKAFDKMREELCEDANDLVEAMIGDRIDEMLTDAIRADGRGHFLAGYDGDEHDAPDGGYFYRVN
jgi:hypothetical protein